MLAYHIAKRVKPFAHICGTIIPIVSGGTINMKHDQDSNSCYNKPTDCSVNGGWALMPLKPTMVICSLLPAAVIFKGRKDPAFHYRQVFEVSLNLYFYPFFSQHKQMKGLQHIL